MHKNITLNEARDKAFLAKQSFESFSNGREVTNPATGSSFEVVEQTNEDGGDFSGTLFKNTETNEYVIAFRGTEFPDEFSISKIAEAGLDARAEAGELKSLKEHGIKSINL